MDGKPRMTVQLFLKLCLMNGILTQEECVTALTTGLLPDDILKRLKLADKRISN